jgi:hypothetical protein
MSQRQRLFAAIAGSVLFVGCAQPKMSLEDLKKIPKPQRPAELALLEPMVGSWTATGELIMPGIDKPLSGTGSSTMAWDCDGRVLVEHFEWQSPEMGESGTMKGLVMYTYDPRENEFNFFLADSDGQVSHGEMKFDETTKSWNVEQTGRNPMTGEKTKAKGTLRMPDNNTIEWQMVQHDSMGLTKTMEMKGTSKRK